MPQIKATELHKYIGGWVSTYVSHNDWCDFQICSVVTLRNGSINVTTRSRSDFDVRRYDAGDYVNVFTKEEALHADNNYKARLRNPEPAWQALYEQERKLAVAQYGLPETATWDEIDAKEEEQKDLRRQLEAVRLKLANTATWDDILASIGDEERQRRAAQLKLPETATWDDIYASTRR